MKKLLTAIIAGSVFASLSALAAGMPQTTIKNETNQDVTLTVAFAGTGSATDSNAPTSSASASTADLMIKAGETKTFGALLKDSPNAFNGQGQVLGSDVKIIAARPTRGAPMGATPTAASTTTTPDNGGIPMPIVLSGDSNVTMLRITDCNSNTCNITKG